MGGGGKGGTTTSSQTVSIPPEVLARYNAVNAQAETVAQQPFQQYGGEFVAPLTPTQVAGTNATNAASSQAQPYYGAATALTLGGAQNVGPLTQGQIGYYQNPYTQAVVNPTVQALQQQQGQQLSQQQAEAIKGGAFGGDRANLQRSQLQGQQNLALGQAIAPLYQQGYGQAVQTAQGQQGVIASDLARQMQAGQQIAGLGTGAQQAALQGAQAQLAAGQVGQQTQQAQDTAQYQQFLQERGYPFQVAQFLANIAMGTGALSGSTTSGTQTSPGGFFSDKRLKNDVKEIGETHDGQPIYSYKYNGDDRTQIGLMAQDVEKKHPDAVGLMGGYKTVDYKKATEGAERTHKDMGGGLMPDGFDPNSMGGAVTMEMAGEGFERGGYVGGGLVDSNDWASIVAANKQALGVYGGAQPMGGGAPGATGIVPAATIPVPKPIEAAKMSMPAQRPSGLSTAMQTGKDISSTYNMGKAGLIGSAPTKEDPTGSAGLIGGQGEWGGKNLFSKAKELFAADGGLIVPRHAYADGGSETDNEVTPYDPAETMRGEDPMKDVLASGSKTPQQLKSAQLSMGPNGQQGGGLLGAAKDVAGLFGTAKMLGEGASWLGSTAIPFLFAADGGRIPAYADGGLVPRQGYAEGGSDDIPAQATEAPVETAPIDDRLDRTLGALKRIESSGDYGITGPTSRRGDKPYGAYQIMGANIPSWTEAALGRRMTPDEFLKDQAAQDATARHRAGLYLKQYDDPRQVASMWLSGKPMEKAGDVADVLGTNVPKYVSMFDRYYGGQDLAPAGKQPGLKPPADIGGAAPTGAEGKKSIGDVVTSEGFIVPALGFLGSMLASDKRNLGQALGEGIMGGVGAYQSQRKMLPEVAKTEAEASLQNVAAINSLSSGLKQYNAMNGTNLTLQQFAKLSPAEIAKYAGAEAAGAVSGQKTSAKGYSFTPEEMQTLVIKHPGGADIPAYMDPGYLNEYKSHYAGWGDNPYAKSQLAFADKQIEKTGTTTLSSAGEVVPTPGAIQTGQQALSGQQRVAMSSDFEKKGAEFRPMSVNIETHLDQLADALQRFKTGADAPSRANLSKLMEAVDPDHKFKSLHNNEGTDYDKIIKSAMAIQISQLQGLSARAPAAELNALSQQIVRPIIQPEAARQIVANLKATNAYQRKMYDEYDPEKFGYNISSYQKDFIDKNPYPEFRDKIVKDIAPGAGTQQQREQTVSDQPPVSISSVDDVSKLKPGTPFTIPSGPNKGKIGYAQ